MHFCAWRIFACRVLAALGIAIGMSFGAEAQTIPSSEQPGRQQQRFEIPAPALARPVGPHISLPSTVAPPGAERVFLVVKSFRVTGSTVYTPAQLAPLYAGLIGRKVPLAAIYAVARRITAKYGNDGYVLSRAIVPPQDLNPKGANVHLQIIEGYIDKVVWPPLLAHYRDFFSGYAAKIVAARPANIHVIERYLLLAGDLPGFKFGSSLEPSATTPDASTLVVTVKYKPVDAAARVDNRGTIGRGPWEYYTSGTFNNLLHTHGALTLSAAGAFPLQTLQFYDAYYRQVLDDEGMTAYIHANYSWGWPDTASLQVLDFKSRSLNADAGLYYPVIRSREDNLTVTGSAFLSDNHADVLQSPFNEDRLRGFRLKADGDFADGFNGINQGTFTFSQGIWGLGSTPNGNPLASRLAGRVDFSKIEASLSRTQPLIDNFSLYAAAYGQYAFTPLLVPEQCGYGGFYFGRAFEPSQYLGDSCWELSGELRNDLPIHLPHLTQAQLYGFSDYGHLYTLDAAPGTPAQISAASVGAGLRLGWANIVSTDLEAAKGIDGPIQDWRFFFVASAHY